MTMAEDTLNRTSTCTPERRRSPMQSGNGKSGISVVNIVRHQEFTTGWTEPHLDYTVD